MEREVVSRCWLRHVQGHVQAQAQAQADRA